MFESLIQKVEDHPKYGPAMAEAATGKFPLVLDYHTHTTADDYCVSICSKTESPIKILDSGEGNLEELESGDAAVLGACMRMLNYAQIRQRETMEAIFAPRLVAGNSSVSDDEPNAE